MGAGHWVVGFVGVGAVVGLVSAAGCGSSSSGGESPDASDDGAVDAPCIPEDATYPNSGACGDCITTMCATQLQACNQDCTCGMQVNTLANCLTTNPPPALGGPGGGLTGLLGTEAGAQLVSFLMCAGAGAGGGGGLAGGLAGGGLAGGGLAAGGTAGGMAGGMSSAASNYATCLLMTCGSACGPEGGVEGGPEAGDGGNPESSAGDSGTDTGADAGTTPETGASDAPSESSSDGGGSSDDAGDAGNG